MKKTRLDRKLLRAVETNSCDMVEPLLEHGADPLANNCRALAVAIELGRTEIIKKFVCREVDVDQPWIYPLKTAIQNNQLETLAYLRKVFLFFPDDLEAACSFAIRKDWGQAMSILLGEDVDLHFSLVEECVENDSINCFRLLIEHGVNPQIQAAQIVEYCVEHAASSILTFMLENFPPGAQVLNSWLVRVTCERSTDFLKILLNHGANGVEESTDAFIEALKNCNTIDAAELLLPNINIALIDDRDFANLARCCAWDLAKRVLKRGIYVPAKELDYYYAVDFVEQLEPEDFFALDDGLPITTDFLDERLRCCFKLGRSAGEYVQHYENDDPRKKVKIAEWLLRCVRIRVEKDAARKARR